MIEHCAPELRATDIDELPTRCANDTTHNKGGADVIDRKATPVAVGQCRTTSLMVAGVVDAIDEVHLHTIPCPRVVAGATKDLWEASFS